jgi:hypothetical protein
VRRAVPDGELFKQFLRGPPAEAPRGLRDFATERHTCSQGPTAIERTHGFRKLGSEGPLARVVIDATTGVRYQVFV